MSFPITALRSVDLRVPSLAAAERFYTGVWGLTLVERTPSTVLLRGTGTDHHILALHGGPPAILSATFRARDPGVFAPIAARTVAAGGRVLAPEGPVDWPGGGTGMALADPRGRVLRLVHGDARRTADAPSPDRPERLSHINVNSSETDATATFFTDVLGFKLTDRSKMMAFVRCNGEHHVVVIADAPVDGLNHVAFMMTGWEGVMRGAGRLIDHGVPVAWGVGRHGPGDNVFAYFVDPFGFVIEYTAEVLAVDDSYRVGGPEDWVWPAGRTDQWGIAPPKSDGLKQAQLAIRFAAPEQA